MSDPVTNVEIEDVLSSIRKLVSEGGQAQTRDSVPEAAPEPAAVEEQAAAPESKPAKLVLTPAFMVSDGESDAQPAEDMPVPEDTSDMSDIVWEEVDEAAPAEASQPSEEAPESTVEGAAPFTLRDAISEPETAPVDDAVGRSELEATIAELEASVSTDEFEPDGSEDLDEVQSMVWPGHHPRNVDAAEEAELSEAQGATTPVEEQQSVDDEEASGDEARFDEDDVLADDDELEAFLEGESLVDEAALRQLVSEIVREELQGNMGERITRNVRKLVRREIYRILSSQEFD